mmetsp:Transcript_24384/g.44096  ORF Transcript_24384/g.44096 Transcript_24384/m.44096 type:complete len:388 (+) Transcript_24384:172-1335(+)
MVQERITRRWIRVLSIFLLFILTASVRAFSLSPLYSKRVDNTMLHANSSGKCLDGCVCVVTGASRGIGKGIATALAKESATIYVTGTSSSCGSPPRGSRYATDSQVGGPGTVEETASLINKLGGKGIAVVCNHANDDEVKALFEQVEKEQGRLDILVNNVFRIPPGGLEKLMGKFWEQDVEAWDALHTVGLRSHFVASSFAVPLMLKSSRDSTIKRPFIAMISSFGGLSYTFSVPYGVGKAGVDRLAKDMAVELQSEDVCVVSFYPGLVQTERTNLAVANGDWDKYVGIPLDKSETPEFSGRAVLAVATDPDNMKKSGTVQVVAELAEEYGFTDVSGKRPPSIRSFKFLIPTYGMDEEQRKKVPDWLIPNWKLPFWVMAGGRPPDQN